MAYFYYVQKLGQLHPRVSQTHPKDRLQPEKAIAIVELKPEDLGLTLNQLSLRYPFTPKGTDNDQR